MARSGDGGLRPRGFHPQGRRPGSTRAATSASVWDRAEGGCAGQRTGSEVMTRNWSRWLTETQLEPGAGSGSLPPQAPADGWWHATERPTRPRQWGRILRVVGVVILVLVALSAASAHADNGVAQVITAAVTIAAFPVLLYLAHQRRPAELRAHALICGGIVIYLVSGSSALYFADAFDNCGTAGMVMSIGLLALSWKRPRATLWILFGLAGLGVAGSVIGEIVVLFVSYNDPIPAWARAAFVVLDALLLYIAVLGLRATHVPKRATAAA